MSEAFRDPLVHPAPTPVFVFDIDGTLANGQHRRHYIVPPAGAEPNASGKSWRLPDGTVWKKNWPAYFAAAHADTLIGPVAETLLSLIRAGAACVYCTTRVAENIDATREWLARMGLPDVDIFHRPPNDFRDDNIVKLELLKEIEAHGYRIVMLFDDRKRVVMAARGAGYTVAHIDDGEF